MAPGRPPLGPAYHRLWASTALSNLADGVLKVALPLIALGYTRSPPLIAGVAVAAALPWLLFALPAGALVDRLDRRRLMAGANALRAAVAGGLVLVLLLDAGSIQVLYVVALVAGTAETLHDTAAPSVLPQLVPSDQLPRANGRLFAVELTANELVGPPLAGVLVALAVVAAPAAPALLWGVAAVLVPALGRSLPSGPPRRDRGTWRADVAEGLRFLGRHRVLRAFTAMTGLFNLTSSATQAVLVLYAVGSASPMGLTEQGYGWLLGAWAAGCLLGSFLVERLQRALGRARAIGSAFLVAALAVGLPGLTAHPVAVGAGFLVGGVGLVVANVATVSLRQRITPGPLAGRVHSAHRLVGFGAKPLGAALGGGLAELLGLRAVFLVMGGLALLALVGMRAVTDAAMDAAETGHDPDGPSGY
ncbi:MFS transporter [Pseudonocardia humida]|uniref:MFS transporter n=1 Tax=Pseudonocardia humida TaxID=2800819 RepID=A0ABT1ACT4_9PSEU|nr:MFS transporter [Pseudonocardia humida]MCO1660776.1 MFS transporter [Pseudonocardia humida]